ncbi:MAG: zinc-ribbon domain-containing protein [Pseudoramibacter sp.]
MKTCQKCGYENEDGAAFCKNCGEALKDTAEAESENKSEAKETEQSMQAPPKKPKSEKLSPTNRKIIIAIIAAAVAAMAFIGVWAYRNKQSSGGNQTLMGTTNSNALFSLQNGSDGSSQEGGSVVTRGNDLYYLYQNSLRKKKGVKGRTTTVYRAGSDAILNHLNYNQGWFYFAKMTPSDEAGSGDTLAEVYKVRADGKNLTKLFTQKHVTSSEMIVYDGRIYWSHYGRMDSALYAYDLNGKHKKVLIEDEQGGDGDTFPIYKFAIDHHKLYIPAVGEGAAIDLKNNTKKKFELDVQGGLEDEHLLPFTEANGKLYGAEADTSDPETPVTQIYQYDLQSKKLKTVIDSLGSDETLAVFADQKQCYILTEDTSGDRYTLLDKDQNTIASFKDLYRIALTDKGFYVVDTDGKVHFYKKTAKAKASTKTAKRATENTSLSNLQIGVLTSLYHWSEDGLKECINYTTWGSENVDGTNYYYVALGTDKGSLIHYRLDGDTVIYKYYTVSGDEDVAHADENTKTVSLKFLIAKYYKTDSQKAEVDQYVSKIQNNTQEDEQYAQQNNNSNNSNSSDSYSSSSSDNSYDSDDDSSSTNTDSNYQDDSSEDYE